MKKILINIKCSLEKLSYKTGVFLLLCCIPFYILSFLQFSLPVSVAIKGTLWVILFGLAKTFQYAGLTVIGAKGIKDLKNRLRLKLKKTA